MGWAGPGTGQGRAEPGPGPGHRSGAKEFGSDLNVVKNYGGHAIAVHKPDDKKAIEVCRQLLNANRIDFFTSADYSTNSELERLIKKVINLMIARIDFEKEKTAFNPIKTNE